MATVDWITLAEYKAQAELTSSASDTVIQALISAASRALNNRAKRELTPQSTATRTLPVDVDLFPNAISGSDLFPFARGSALVPLAPYDLRAAATVRLHPEEAALTETLTADVDYALFPLPGHPVSGTFTGIRLPRTKASLMSTYAYRFGFAKIEIAGDWGAWATAGVPEDAKRACVATVGSWLDRAVKEYAADLGDGNPRLIRPDPYAGWAVPRSALNLLSAAGLMPFPTIR